MASKMNKSDNWTLENLELVLKKLKNGKSKDAYDLVNELFKLDNIGTDLKHSILMMLNSIKKEMIQPEFMEVCKIIPFYKGKGEMSDLDNYRGIFILNILRMIKDKMIINDVEDIVEPTMSDSQVGGRRKKGCRNHLFVLYSCMNSAKQKESKPIDVKVYDVSKCFDKLSLEEVCNNIYDIGVTDDKMAMIYEGNKINKVMISIPSGMTEPIKVEKLVTQGGSLGPKLCSIQIDNIGKEALDIGEHLYMYKGEVGIPPLRMIDDVLDISECGVQSVIDNAYINAQIEMSKLKFNKKKCHQLHIGAVNPNYPKLFAHEEIMTKVSDDKYLGDQISHDLKFHENIELRCSRGLGVISDLMSLLDELRLGNFHFEMGLLLRQSKLHSMLLNNTECWLDLTKTDIEELEAIDLILLRKLVEAPSTTPIPAIYLELGCMPLSFKIVEKRMMFLHYILKEEKYTIISKVFWAQVRKPVKNDWAVMVREDLNKLNLFDSFEQIEKMTKSAWKKKIQKVIKEKAFKYLTDQIQDTNMTTVIKLKYSDMKVQEYFQFAGTSKNIKKFIFKLRTRMIQVGNNSWKKEPCPVCKMGNNDQKHLLECTVLKSRNLVANMDEMNYDDIYGEDATEVVRISKILFALYQKRDVILEETSIF